MRLAGRADAVGAATLAVVAACSWLALLLVREPPDASLAGFVALWLAMMTAMMLPSLAPLALLLGPRERLPFLAGYLAVWGAIGAGVWAARGLAGASLPTPAVVMIVLLAAGLYQFAPLKAACLRACRSPADFLLTHWRRGLAGAARMGAAYGRYCLGCCWLLTAVLVVAGGMGFGWVALIALVVTAEKLLPRGAAVGRAVGVVLVAAGLAILVDPSLASYFVRNGT